jgi:ribosomal 30S subunit maturation factor RimM
VKKRELFENKNLFISKNKNKKSRNRDSASKKQRAQIKTKHTNTRKKSWSLKGADISYETHTHSNNCTGIQILLTKKSLKK